MPQAPAPAAQVPAGQAPEALDLFGAVIKPVMRPAAPVLAGLAAGRIIGLLFGHRRRVEVVVAPVPEKMSRTRAAL